MGSRSWEEIQIKAFTYWTNGYLSKEDAVSNLRNDFVDGLRLIHLIEALTNTPVQKYKRKPSIRVHYIENVNLALLHLSRLSELRLTAYVAEDFVDGNLKSILGFLWSLLRYFRVERMQSESAKGKSFEESLLIWLREVLEGYDLPIQNLSAAFKDGRVLSALLHKYDASLIDYDGIDPDNALENVQEAIDLLEKHASVPVLFSAKQILSDSVDERSLVLYMSLIQRSLAHITEARSVSVEKKSIHDKLEEAEGKLRCLTSEHELISKSRGDLASDLESARVEIGDWKSKYEAICDNHSAQQLSLDVATSREQYLEEKVAVLEEMAASQCDEKTHLEMTVRKLEEQVQQLLSNQTQAEHARMTLQQRVDQLRTTEEKLELELSEVRQEKDKLLSQHKDQVAANRLSLGVLKENLLKHLHDMHTWKGILDKNHPDHASSSIQAYVEREISDSLFQEQVQYLSTALSSENEKLESLLDVWRSEKSKSESVTAA